MSVGQYVLFHRTPNFSLDDLAETGKIVEDKGLTKIVRMWSTEDNYLELELPNTQIVPARTVWKIRGSPMVLDHRPLVVGSFFAGFIWEWLF